MHQRIAESLSLSLASSSIAAAAATVHDSYADETSRSHDKPNKAERIPMCGLVFANGHRSHFSSYQQQQQEQQDMNAGYCVYVCV